MGKAKVLTVPKIVSNVVKGMSNATAGALGGTSNAMSGDARYQAPATSTRATEGLITNPIQPNYSYTDFIGNTQAVRDAYQKATGYVVNNQTGSGFSPASVKNDTPWTSNIDEIRAKYGGGGGGGYSPSYVSAASLNRIGQFTPSQAYIDAMNYTQSLLDKINTGRTSYSDKVDAMMAKIEGRDPFSYDFNTDPLFQNMLGAAMASGQTAMQDTMGQAAALTGGYGSSYATSAGNQAYNQFVQNAYAQLPDFYNLALEAYAREGDEMYRQLGMYSDADDKEYGRLTNAYGLNYQKAQDMYGQEYNNYWDTANYNLNVDKFNADAAMDAAQFNASQALNAAKLNANSASAGSASEGGAGASSADYTKALNMAEDLIATYDYDSDALLDGVSRIADTYNLSDQQIATLWSQLKAASDTKKVKNAAQTSFNLSRQANKAVIK